MLNEMQLSLETSDALMVHLLNGDQIKIDRVEPGRERIIHAHGVNHKWYVICTKQVTYFEVDLEP